MNFNPMIRGYGNPNPSKNSWNSHLNFELFEKAQWDVQLHYSIGLQVLET